MRLPGLRRLVRLPWRNASRIARDVDDEFRFHLELRVEELEARGLSREEARRRALARFGDVDDAREYCRAMDARFERDLRRRDRLGDLRHDLRHAARQMVRSPGVTLLATVTLALGIGATTAIFSVVNRLLINPIPIADGDRIVSLNLKSEDGTLTIYPASKVVDAWRARVRSVEEIATSGSREVTLAFGDELENVNAGEMSANLLHFLHTRPALGRAFHDDDAKPGAPKVAMVSYGFWRGRLGGDAGVIGRTLNVDGEPHTISGVLPPDFSVPFAHGVGEQLWLPFVVQPDVASGQALARLRLGTTRTQLEREMADAMAVLATETNTPSAFKPVAMRPQDYLGRSTRDTLLILLGAVGLVLLIACANIANVLLARASVRRREFVVRCALGAGRGRIVRQLLTESALLAAAGGVMGLIVAWLGLSLIVRMRPQQMDELAAVRLEPSVLAVSLVVSMLTGLMFGIAPALFAAEGQLGDALKGAGRHSAGQRPSTRLRGALVMVEVTLSVVLLVGAGLLVRTLVEIQRTPIGFEPHGLYSAQIRLPARRYKTREERAAAMDAALKQVRATPGLGDAAWALGAPLAGGITFGSFEVEGRAQLPEDQAAALGFNAVSQDYFRVSGIPIRDGQAFGRNSTAQNAVVINETLARKYWPATSPVGRRLRLSNPGEWDTVVGVVADVVVASPGATHVDRMIYVPFGGMNDEANPEAALLIRSNLRAASISSALVRAIGAVDPLIRVREPVSAEQTVAREMARPKFNVVLLAAFALIALVLAAVGLYGVIAYSVSQRVREMGIRLALGARPAMVLRLVLSEGVRLTGIGLAAGLLAAAAATRVMENLLYGVSPIDPGTYVAVGLVLAAIALAAAYVPALRATRVDPVVTLRAE